MVAGHTTNITALQNTTSTHTTDIAGLKDANIEHNALYESLKSIVDGHTSTIAGKADSAQLSVVSAKASANETAIKTLNETTIPGINTEIGKKANSADVYTKTEINDITGAVAEGKTLVQMISDA